MTMELMTDRTACETCGKALTMKQRKAYAIYCPPCDMVKAKDMLRIRFARKGSTLYTILRHVSRSGMERRLDVYCIHRSKPVYITGWIGQVLDSRKGSDGTIIIGGCGFDAGHDIVHHLSRELYGDGYALKQDAL